MQLGDFFLFPGNKFLLFCIFAASKRIYKEEKVFQMSPFTLLNCYIYESVQETEV